MRRQLALLILAALLPLVVVGAVLGTYALTDARAAMRARAEEQAQAVAALVGRELAADMRAAQMITQSPAFDAGLDMARFDQLARRLLAQEPMWQVIAVAAPTGERLAGVTLIPTRPRGAVVDRESLRRAVETRRPQVGRVGIGAGGFPDFPVRAPVERDGRVVSVVSLVIRPDQFQSLLLPTVLPQGWSLRLVDDRGGLVTAVGRPQLRGATELTVAKPVPEVGWRVVVAIPSAAYDAPLIEAAEVAAASGLLCLALSLLLWRLLVREMEREKAREAQGLLGQRLEVLGRMTGGVAHDFNNLLTPIIGGLDLLQRRHAGDPRSGKLVEGALASAERARALVRQLLAFARKQTLEPRDVEVSALLVGMRGLIEPSLGPKVALDIITPRKPLYARVDPIQLELALLNLAVNGRDAMPDGGRLSLSAAAVEGGPAEGVAPGPYVRITVADSGTGMDAATLRQAVEPFFTTKPPAQGTGLGLSMVHGLAAQSGGVLRLVSAPGAGTTAEVWLPAADSASAPAAEPVQAAEAGPAARVLLVDDEALVLSATAEMLREHGHAVVEAGSAAEALAALEEDAGIEALVTDYRMPETNGAELIRRARALRPALPVLLITGFTHAAEEVPAEIARLAKPFRAADLLERVAAVVRRETAAAPAE